jgi:hypothetical protein
MPCTLPQPFPFHSPPCNASPGGGGGGEAGGGGGGKGGKGGGGGDGGVRGGGGGSGRLGGVEGGGALGRGVKGPAGWEGAAGWQGPEGGLIGGGVGERDVLACSSDRQRQGPTWEGCTRHAAPPPGTRHAAPPPVKPPRRPAARQAALFCALDPHTHQPSPFVCNFVSIHLANPCYICSDARMDGSGRHTCRWQFASCVELSGAGVEVEWAGVVGGGAACRVAGLYAGRRGGRGMPTPGGGAARLAAGAAREADGRVAEGGDVC